MTGVGIIEAVLLGALQGLTEFLPVSSSGHLALAQLLFDVDEGSLTLNVVLHAGTLLATLVFFHRRVWEMTTDSWRVLTRRAAWPDASGAHDAAFVVVASIPTAAIGLALRDHVEIWSRTPWVLGVGFLTTAAMLMSTRWVAPSDMEKASLRLALLLGFVQGCAVLPGVSRSGSTITVALWSRVAPARAFELSMLMSLPAVFGAFLLELRHVVELGDGVVALAIGAATAFVVGYFALLFLRRLVTAGRLALFVLWMLPLALATLGLAWSWPIG